MNNNMQNILIINGPNLNLLGRRENNIYGKTTLADIERECKEKASSLNASCDCIQSNSESEIIEAIHNAETKYHAIIINAGAYTHTSIAIHDALRTFSGKIIEVHISNIYSREEFRHHSYISPVANAVLCGFGGYGYLMAIEYALKDG